MAEEFFIYRETGHVDSDIHYVAHIAPWEWSTRSTTLLGHAVHAWVTFDSVYEIGFDLANGRGVRVQLSDAHAHPYTGCVMASRADVVVIARGQSFDLCERKAEQRADEILRILRDVAERAPGSIP